MRIPILLAIAAVVAAGAAHAASFRAPRAPAPSVAALEAPLAKAAAPSVDDAGRLRVADVRALPKAASIPAWTPVAGGWISRFTVSSDGAAGLRTRLDLGAMPGDVEVRVQGTGEVETQVVDPRNGPDAWTAWTEGDTQVVE